MAVLMLGDQVAVLMIEDQEPSAAEAVVQNKCSRSHGTEQSAAKAVVQSRAAEAWMEEYSLC
jgi:hypothetical protein